MVTGYSEEIFPPVVDSDEEEYEDENMATFFLNSILDLIYVDRRFIRVFINGHIS